MRWILGAAAALFVQTAAAQDTAPDALVRSVTQDVIGVVKQDSAIQGGNRERAIASSSRRYRRISISRA